MEFEIFDDIDEGTGSGSFQDMKATGVVDVELRRIGLTYNKSGSVSITVTVNGGGEYDNTYYQGVVKNKDGSPGFENNRLLQPLRMIAGLNALPVIKETIKTKNGSKEIDVFDGFKGVKCKLAIQSTYNDYNDSWQPSIVKAFYEDGRTASEVKDGVSTPEQIKYFLSDKFQDKGPKGKSKSKSTGSVPDIDIDDEDIGF